MKKLALPFLLIVLSGCGSDAFIAKKVKFKVLFAQKIVQVKFELNPKYHVQTSKSFDFDRLGTTFLKWTEELKLTEVGSYINADPTVLKMDWPTAEIKAFPNGKPLPPSVISGSISSWNKSEVDLSSQFLYQGEPHLISGGSFLSKQFDQFPKKFLATQRFFNPNGDIEATISVAGPTADSLGGLYFFGNFGINPFIASRSASAFMGDSSADEWNWELNATEAAQIISNR